VRIWNITKQCVIFIIHTWATCSVRHRLNPNCRLVRECFHPAWQSMLRVKVCQNTGLRDTNHFKQRYLVAHLNVTAVTYCPEFRIPPPVSSTAQDPLPTVLSSSPLRHGTRCLPPWTCYELSFLWQRETSKTSCCCHVHCFVLESVFDAKYNTGSSLYSWYLQPFFLQNKSEFTHSKTTLSNVRIY
jgi:hypothetical protein